MKFFAKFCGPHLGLILLLSVLLPDSATCDEDADRIYHNQFAVLVPKGHDTADQVAAVHGFVNLGQIGSLDNYFLFEHARLQRRSTELSDVHGEMLAVEPDVAW